MTPAKTEQEKHNPWFAKAGAACSIVPISRFVGPNVFALKGGGYGCLFSLTGLDEEALTDLELESRVRSIEGALRGLPEGSCLYQYTRVMSGFDLPRQKQYQNKVTETFASDRLAHLNKTAGFRRIDLHWCLTLEPGKVKAFQRKPKENSGDTSRMLRDLEKTATLLSGHLGNSIGLRLLSKQEAFQFLSRVMSGRDTASLETGASAKAANNNVDDLSDVIRALDKKSQGEFSLRLLLAAHSQEQLRDVVPNVHRIFVDAMAQVMEETLGNLSAFYAMFPGNHKFNVFPLWLAEDLPSVALLGRTRVVCRPLLLHHRGRVQVLGGSVALLHIPDRHL